VEVKLRPPWTVADGVADDDDDDGDEDGCMRETSISTPVMPKPGWARGTMSAVRLAAMMPAMRETASTSPFFVWPEEVLRSEYGVELEKVSVQVAVASRDVSALWVMEVIWTVSDGVRCGRVGWEVCGRSEGGCVARVSLDDGEEEDFFVE
jgi:hypothetical protein